MAESYELRVHDTTSGGDGATYTVRALSNWALNQVFEKLDVGRPEADRDYELTMHMIGTTWVPLKRDFGHMTLEDLSFNTLTNLRVSKPPEAGPSLETDPSAVSAPPPLPPVVGPLGPGAYKHTPYVWQSAECWDKKSETGFVGLANQGAT